MADHPGVIFKDGPSGRVPRWPMGPTSGRSSSSCARSTSGVLPPSTPPPRSSRSIQAGSHRGQLLPDTPMRSTRRSPRPTRHRRVPRQRGGSSGSSSHEARPDVRLVLDEMFSPASQTALCNLGHDVVAVAEQLTCARGLTTRSSRGRPPRADGCSPKTSRTSGRSCRAPSRPGRPVPGCCSPAAGRSPGPGNSGPLIMALHAWLTAGAPAPPVRESWLLGAADSQ